MTQTPPPTDPPRARTAAPGGAVGNPEVGGLVGRVAALARYPLRSAGGEHLQRACCTTAGLQGDRAFVLVDEAGHALRGKEAPALRRLTAALVGAHLQVRDAAGSVLDDAALPRATGVVGATTAPAEDHGVAPGSASVAPVHLVSVGAEAGPDAAGCDPEPRANVVLELVGQAPGAERGWVGAVLEVGTARLRITRRPRSCLGVYADVERPGEMAVGDPVRLSSAPA